MKGKAILISLLFLVLVATLLTIRFLVGGPEDDWICVKGEWLKHGNPNAPKPDNGCGENLQIANPASVYCEDQGGVSEIRTQADGGQLGWCRFADGRECDEWEFFRNKTCGATSSPTASVN